MSSKPSILLDFSLLKTNRAFRAVFCARFISIVALGLMAIAIPVQIQALTGSTLQVGLAVTLAGGGMFAGLLMGGVLADRYERRRLILFARSTCGVGSSACASTPCCRRLRWRPSICWRCGTVSSARWGSGAAGGYAGAGGPRKHRAGGRHQHADGALRLDSFPGDWRPGDCPYGHCLELRPGGVWHPVDAAAAAEPAAADAAAAAA